MFLFFLNISVSFISSNDSSWSLIVNFLPIIIGVVGLILTGITILQQHHRKEIKYQIVFDPSIARISDTAKNLATNLIQGKREQYTRLVILKVWNAGDTSIKEEDYFENFSFKFNLGEITEIKFLEVLPASLNIPQLSKSSNSIMVSKISLNPKDYFCFAALLKYSTDPTKLVNNVVVQNGRIADGRVKESFLYDEFSNKFFTINFFLMYGLCASTFYTFPLSSTIFLLNLIFILVVLFLSPTVIRRKFRNVRENSHRKPKKGFEEI